MAVATHPHHRIPQFRFGYVYTIATDGGSVADGGFQRSLKRHVADVKNFVGDDQDRSKFRKYANLCLQDQAKRLEKLLFTATNDAAIDGIAHHLLSCYHS